MFSIDKDTLDIKLSEGDTLALDVSIEGLELTAADRVMFTIKKIASKTSPALIQKFFTPVNNIVTLELTSEDTSEILTVGQYVWDLRVLVNPSFDVQGVYQTADRVLTPVEPTTFEVVKVVGDV